MRITIETQNEGRIVLEPEKMDEKGNLLQGQSQQQESQEAPLDGGGPSDELMTAIAGAAASFDDEEIEDEEGVEILNVEDSSSFH